MMTETYLIFPLILAFIIGLWIAVKNEKKRLIGGLWRECINEMKTTLRWIQFAASQAEDINHKMENSEAALDIFHTVFKKAKYYLGTRKDSLLNDLKIDVESLKEKIGNETCKKSVTDLNSIKEPEERLEYVITSFCTRNSMIKLSDFIKGNYVDEIQTIYNTLEFLEQKHRPPALPVKTLILSYLPMVVSFISAVAWIIKKIL